MRRVEDRIFSVCPIFDDLSSNVHKASYLTGMFECSYYVKYMMTYVRMFIIRHIFHDLCWNVHDASRI